MKKLLNTVYINNPDRYLSLDSENLVISYMGDEIGRVPLHNIERIISFGYTGASPALMGKCAENKIDLVFMSKNGHFIAKVEGKTRGNVFLRRQQYRMADNIDQSLSVSKNIITAKLHNSRWVIERAIRDHELRIDIDLFKRKSLFLKEAMKSAYNSKSIDSLRGIEGEGASVYFSVFNDMILQQKEDFFFKLRSKRPALDNVNSLLSFTYSLTTSMYSSALESVGLDPFVGVMHTERSGRCSLSLDLIEEVRSVLCDRFVLSIINKRIINKEDFIRREDGAVILTNSGRKKFFVSWEKKLHEQLKHPFIDERIEWGMVPYVQALLLARYIRGDLDLYPPFMWK